MKADNLVNALLEAESGNARDFLKSISLATPEVELERLGFKRIRGRSVHPIYALSYPRPASMPTPYDWSKLVLTVEITGGFEIGLCTMGQCGADYPDLWMGHFQKHELIPVLQAMKKVLENLPDDVTYDKLDRLLRQACGRPRTD